MNEPERYEDPLLARRFKDWVEDAAPPMAPERLVHSIMDEVERSPRRRPWLRELRDSLLPRPAGVIAGVGRYALLTIAIAIGVATGILVTRELPGVGPPGPGPSPASTEAPSGATPALVASVTLNIQARAVATETSLWVATAAGTLLELDRTTGTQLRPVAVGLVANDLAVGDGTVLLVSPDGGAAVDLATGAISPAPALAGDRVVFGGGWFWVGRAEEVVRVDPGSLADAMPIEVTGHRAGDPLAVVGGELWVATNQAIQRFELESLAAIGSLPGDASGIVEAGGLAWVVRGNELLRIDPTTSAIEYAPGQIISDLATDGTRVWLVGPPGGGAGELVEVDVTSGATISRTSFEASAVAVAATSGGAWVATEEDGLLRRFAPAP